MAQSDTAQERRWPLPLWAALLRPAHWSKNLLLAVPPVFAHSAISLDLVVVIAMGVVAMSLAASAGYIVNDLIDAKFDRLHAHKSRRPIARELVSPGYAAAAAFGLVAASLGIAVAMLGSTATWMIVAYLGATIAYSSYLKRVAGADILVLAGLYIWRLLIGGEITGTPLSAWLICFAANLFIALALMKRIDELASLKSTSAVVGRGYDGSHWPALLTSAIVFATAALLTSAAYIAFSEAASLHYRSEGWLWLSTLAFVLWLIHLTRRSTAGRMRGDPVAFTATDPVSLALIAGGTIAYLAAI